MGLTVESPSKERFPVGTSVPTDLRKINYILAAASDLSSIYRVELQIVLNFEGSVDDKEISDKRFVLWGLQPECVTTGKRPRGLSSLSGCSQLSHLD